jgi:hypothetical protein
MLTVKQSRLVGHHRFEHGDDALHVVFDGPVSSADFAEVRRALVEIGAAGGPCFFLADMHGCTGIDAEARKYLSEWSKTGIEKPTAVAAYGIDFAMRALITLTLTAIKFLGLRRIEVALLKDAAEVEAWLTDRRAAFARATQV